MAFRRIAGFVLAASLAAVPALAQNNGTGTGQPATTGTGAATGAGMGTANPAIGSASPATGAGMENPAGGMARGTDQEPNPVLTGNGEFRASKIIGAAVYNDKDQKIGSVDDILLGQDRKAAQAVISVGGVLGLGAKLVEVPYDKLSFPHQVGDTTSRVMMKGATEDSLNGMTPFHYASK